MVIRWVLPRDSKNVCNCGCRKTLINMVVQGSVVVLVQCWWLCVVSADKGDENASSVHTIGTALTYLLICNRWTWTYRSQWLTRRWYYTATTTAARCTKSNTITVACLLSCAAYMRMMRRQYAFWSSTQIKQPYHQAGVHGQVLTVAFHCPERDALCKQLNHIIKQNGSPTRPHRDEKFYDRPLSSM